MKIPSFVSHRFFVIAWAALVVGIVSWGRFCSGPELFFYDLHFQHRETLPVDPGIVIVEISDDTLQALGRWPLPRDFHASLVDVLRILGARQVIFDLLLSEPSPEDIPLSQAMRRAGNVYLPEAFYPEPAPRRTETVRMSRTLLAGVASELSSVMAGRGHINVQVDPDGKVRRVPLFIRHQDSLVPCMGLRIACDLLGIDAGSVEMSRGGVVVDRRLFLPVSRGAFLVNYPGPWKETFRHVSYVDVLRSFQALARQEMPPLDISFLKGKTCFVGLTATGTSDLRANPAEAVYPMVGLQASVLNSILEKRYLREANPWLQAVAALVVFALVLVASLRWAPRFAFFVMVLVSGGYGLLTHGFFVRFGFWLDLFWPLIVAIATYGGCLFYRFWKEARARSLLEKELNIAREIQENFLPRDIRPMGHVAVTALMQPAKFVAGDLYDVIPLEGSRLGVLIGDVSGKGVPAALIMAQTVSFFRIFARQGHAPAEVFAAVNRELVGILDGRFVTALYLVIDTEHRSFEVACAGHPPLMIYRAADRRVEERAQEGGPPLGLALDAVYKNESVSCEAGDKVLLYTDGISEARRGREEFGVGRLKACFEEMGVRTGPETVARIAESVAKFQTGLPQYDDVTLIVVDF